jgi:hypothetical protein
MIQPDSMLELKPEGACSSDAPTVDAEKRHGLDRVVLRVRHHLAQLVDGQGEIPTAAPVAAPELVQPWDDGAVAKRLIGPSSSSRQDVVGGSGQGTPR